MGAEYDSWCIEKGRPERAPQIKKVEKHHVGDPEPIGKRRGGQAKKLKNNSGGKRAPSQDRGERPPGAPSEQEIKQLIQDRNEARKKNDFAKADTIRDELKDKGVILSDEKGGHGS